MSKRTLLLAAAALAAAAPAGAQDVRTVTSMRQFAGEEALRVEVEYGAGEFEVRPGSANTLYRATFRYDAERFQPRVRYADGTLRLAIEGEGKVDRRHFRNSRLDLQLGRRVPIDLDMEFGAGEADIELGGLRLTNLALSTGASETTVRFSEPNPIRCEEVSLEAGAAEFRVLGLGNVNASRLNFDGGVGDLTLDFSGEWRGDMAANIDVGIGALNLRLPRGVGVKITKDTFLSAFSPRGLVKRGSAYYSEDWEQARHRLTINIDAAFGSIDVRWVDGLASRR